MELLDELMAEHDETKRYYEELEKRRHDDEMEEEAILERLRAGRRRIPHRLREIVAPSMRLIMKGVMKGIDEIEARKADNALRIADLETKKFKLERDIGIYKANDGTAKVFEDILETTVVDLLTEVANEQLAIKD